MSSLTACVSVHHMHAEPMETRKVHRIPWDWRSRWLWVSGGWWEVNPAPLEEHPVLLAAEPSRQPLDSNSFESFLEFDKNCSELLCQFEEAAIFPAPGLSVFTDSVHFHPLGLLWCPSSVSWFAHFSPISAFKTRRVAGGSRGSATPSVGSESLQPLRLPL